MNSLQTPVPKGGKEETTPSRSIHITCSILCSLCGHQCYTAMCIAMACFHGNTDHVEGFFFFRKS